MLCCLLYMFSFTEVLAQTSTAYGAQTYATGSNNSLFGDIISTNGGNNNVAMGYRIRSTNSNQNTINTNTSIGSESGFVGSRNVFFGTDTGNWLSQGSKNVFIGNCSSCNTLGYSDNNVFIGDRTGSGTAGNTAGNVFIGYAVGNYIGGASPYNNILMIDNNHLTTSLIYGDFAADKLGINTKNLPNNLNGEDLSTYSLYVKGGLITEQLRAQPGWADYVFEDDYKLMSLKDVEQFIEKNGHLPNVPSAETVQKTGIELGDIKRVQQEKIEELTLYIIDLNEQLQAIKAEIAAKKAAKKTSNKH